MKDLLDNVCEERSRMQSIFKWLNRQKLEPIFQLLSILLFVGVYAIALSSGFFRAFGVLYNSHEGTSRHGVQYLACVIAIVIVASNNKNHLLRPGRRLCGVTCLHYLLDFWLIASYIALHDIRNDLSGSLQILIRLAVTITVVNASISKGSPSVVTPLITFTFPSTTCEGPSKDIRPGHELEDQLLVNQPSFRLTPFFGVSLLGCLCFSVEAIIRIAIFVQFEVPEPHVSRLSIFTRFFLLSTVRWFEPHWAGEHPKSDTSFPRAHYDETAQIDQRTTTSLEDPSTSSLSTEIQRPVLPSPIYAKRNALLVVFEDDNIGDASREAEGFKSELMQRWGFDGAKVYKIRFRSPDTLQELFEQEIKKFISDHDDDSNLLLIHFGCHGTVNHKNEYTLFMEHEPSGIDHIIRLKPIREIFWKCKSDVVMFLDACDSAAGFTRGRETHTFEILAACRSGERTPAVGKYSFTNAILQVLGACEHDITMKELHEELMKLRKLKDPPLLQDPCYKPLQLSNRGSILFRYFWVKGGPQDV